MSKYVELMDKIYAKGGGYERMAEATAILDVMFQKLKTTHADLYNATMHEFEKIAYHIDRPHAEAIAKAMKPYGQKWTYDQVNDYVSAKGIADQTCNWYLAMNMAYNDYKKTADMVDKGDNPEFYFSIAKDFLTDVDAKPLKPEKYFLMA